MQLSAEAELQYYVTIAHILRLNSHGHLPLYPELEPLTNKEEKDEIKHQS